MDDIKRIVAARNNAALQARISAARANTPLPQANEDLKRKSTNAPPGALKTYVAKVTGPKPKEFAGIYSSGRKARPHGFLAGGGSRYLATGSQSVVRPISGKPLF